MAHAVRDRETGYQDFTLYDRAGAYNATGADSVTLELTDRAGGRVDTTGKVSWINQGLGQVRYAPAVGDLVAERGPYTAAFIVTMGARTYAFPSHGPEEWRVWR